MSYTNKNCVEVVDVANDHKSIRAISAIPAGTLLGIFDGQAKMADLGEDETGSNLSDHFWRQSTHLLREGRTLYYLDQTGDLSGIDYLNHSCRPNARVENFLFVYADRDIDLGEEIVADYRTFILIEQGLPCWCPIPRCVL